MRILQSHIASAQVGSSATDALYFHSILAMPVCLTESQVINDKQIFVVIN